MSTPFVRYSAHLTVRETLSRITNVNKSREFIEKFLSKLTFSPLACLSEAFIQTPNIPMKPLDLMPCKWSKYCVRSFTSIRIRLIKIWHPRLAYFYKWKGHTKSWQNFLLFFREANFDSVFTKRSDTWHPDNQFCAIRIRFPWKLAEHCTAKSTTLNIFVKTFYRSFAAPTSSN